MKPEFVRYLIRKAVCEGYKGTCEDIQELDDEEMHSSMQSSGLQVSKVLGSRKNGLLKENDMNVMNKNARSTENKFTKLNNTRYLSPSIKTDGCYADNKESHDTKKRILRVNDERQAQSIDLNNSKDIPSSLNNESRSLSNPTLENRIDEAFTNINEFKTDAFNQYRWLDTNISKTSMQNPIKSQKNEDSNQIRKKSRNFELNRLFKRTLNVTTQSFNKLKNKSDLKLESKPVAFIQENKGVFRNKLGNHRNNMSLMDGSNGKSINLKTFDDHFENSKSHKILAKRSLNKSKSREPDKRTFV